MRSPEDALAAARQRAEARRAAQTPPGAGGEGGKTEDDPRQVSLRQLTVWALIEPEEFEVYSTRRFGAPVTAVKRLLIRLLRQYLGQMSAQQSRFNANVVSHMVALEERVRALEQGRGEAGEGPASGDEGEASGR